MKANIKWTQGMTFEASADSNSVLMDAKAPLGSNKGMTPKELLAAGLGGCTGMDVVALLKKHKQTVDHLAVEVDVNSTTGQQPAVFTDATVTFVVNGNVDKEILIEAVKLSQTKYCGVSAMLAKAFPIKYIVRLNNENIAEGMANFN